MEMKTKGSGPSLTCLRLALHDSIDEMARLCNSRSKDRDVLISGFQTVGVILKSVSLQFQDIKELVRQRKEAISKGKGKGKGKISMCLNFPARYEIRTTESDMKSLEDAVARLAKIHLELAAELHPELFPYASKWYNNVAL